MIRLLKEHRIIFTVLSVLLLIQSFTSDLHNPFRKPIVGDAQGYYAYLPAVFIYQDLSYKFMDEIHDKYYVASTSKSFVNTVDGHKVNKYFPGQAVLYAPFFLAAHGLAVLTGLPADGFSFIYQLFFLIGFWVYFLLGLLFFKKVLLHLGISLKVIHVCLITIVFGTNIFFYSVFDQTVTHVYNFFLCNLLIYLLLKWKQSFDSGTLICFYGVLALVGIIRPTNILVVGVMLFFIPDWSFWKTFIDHSTRFKNAWKIFVIALLIFAIPIVLWKIQTENWIVYSYGKEVFYFDDPHIAEFLFSYTKGWFVYTPVMFFILIFGFWMLFKKDKPRFFSGIVFFTLAVYIFSCWWCWYYGAGMSQRVMIDFYIIPGYLLTLILNRVQSSFVARNFAYTILSVLISFNVAQAYQIKLGILRWGSPTKEEYWANFLRFKKEAKIFPPYEWKLQLTGFVDLSELSLVKGTSVSFEGFNILEANAANQYSAVASTPTLSLRKGSKLVMSFECRSEDEIKDSRIVFVLNNAENFIFFPSEYVSDEWTKMDFLIEPDKELVTPVEFFIWNAGTSEHLQIRTVSWKLYFTDKYF